MDCGKAGEKRSGSVMCAAGSLRVGVGSQGANALGLQVLDISELQLQVAPAPSKRQSLKQTRLSRLVGNLRGT